MRSMKLWLLALLALLGLIEMVFKGVLVLVLVCTIVGIIVIFAAGETDFWDLKLWQIVARNL